MTNTNNVTAELLKNPPQLKQGDIVTVAPIPRGNPVQRSFGIHSTQYTDDAGKLTDNRDFQGENPSVTCKSGKKPDIGDVIKAAEALKTTGTFFSDDDKKRAEPSFGHSLPMQHNLIYAGGSPIKALCK